MSDIDYSQRNYTRFAEPGEIMCDDCGYMAYDEELPTDEELPAGWSGSVDLPRCPDCTEGRTFRYRPGP